MRWEGPNRAELPESAGSALKVCPLCGTPNVVSTPECAICGWHGRFDYSAESVDKALRDLRLAPDEDFRDFFAERASLDEYLGVQSRCVGWIGQIKRFLGFCRR